MKSIFPTGIAPRRARTKSCVQTKLNLRILCREDRNRGHRAVGAIAVSLFCATLLLATVPALAWNSTDMTGTLPPLEFTMTRASDGKTVTAADYKGRRSTLFRLHVLSGRLPDNALQHCADAQDTR